MTDEPNYTALERLVERNHQDLVTAIDKLGLRLDQYLLRDVYFAQHEAMVDKVKRIDEDAEADRQTARAREDAAKQTARTALFAAIGTFLGTLALAALNAFVHTGGH